MGLLQMLCMVGVLTHVRLLKRISGRFYVGDNGRMIIILCQNPIEVSWLSG